MDRTIHFISGLPRSGSTLLAAVLRQNPRIQASATSPVASLALSLLPQMSPPDQFASLFDDERRRAMLRAIFDGYYASPDPRPVVFDTNRIWCGRIALLADLFPASRIVCCVRDIGWIIDSIERMLRRNPLHVPRIFEGAAEGTLYSRVDALMNSDTGLIGAAWSHLREAWFSGLAERMLIVSYEGFVSAPDEAMRRLYQALGEPAFQHDFDHVSHDAPDFDADLAMPGLHRVAPRVARVAREPLLPPDIFSKYAGSAFWRAPTEPPHTPTIIC